MNASGQFPFLSVLVFHSLLISFLSHSTLAAPNLLYTYCPNTTFFPGTNSSYRLTIDRLLSTLSSAANQSTNPGFYYHTIGAGDGTPTAFYGLYLCRGDDDPATCQDCVAAASTDLHQNCPRGKESVIWYDECTVRYSNNSFFAKLDSNFELLMWNTQNITNNATGFNEVLIKTMTKVAEEAASGGSTKKFATAQSKFNSFQSVYVLGQCTPDLSTDDCIQCLQQSIASMPGGNRQGGRVLFSSCNLRYEIYLFYRSLSKISPIYTYCPNTTFNLAAYGSNIDNLLFALSSAANKSSSPGFYNDTIGGDTPTAVYGLYLCRGDVIPATCRDCVAAASTYLPDNCVRSKQAVVLYEVCMIRYSTESFFGQLEPNLLLRRTSSLTNGNDPNFNKDFEFTVVEAITSVKDKVAAGKGEDGKMFGTSKENVTDTTNAIYTLGQCIPDISMEDCNECLENCSKILQSCCTQQSGAGVYFFNCNLRFELYPFYSLADPAQEVNISTRSNSSIGASPNSPSHITPKPNKSTRHLPLIITGSVLIAVVLLFLGFALLFSVFKKLKVKAASTGELSDIVTAESLQMDFRTIRAATQNFAIDKKLGQGGFGSVYKGTLENGQDIAVKRLSDNSGQGIVEFKTEVLLVAKLQHRNLVKLLGFCVSGKEKILVYEFLPNSSLDKILFDLTKRMSLNWEMRFKIICGIAKGLMYLHEDSRLRVVHRDLKSSNILLDDAMNPKISDFGLAKLFGVDQTQAVTDSIAGTYGYMAPEYILMGHYSIKSDVYSFGIIVLEVLSGQRNKYLNRPLLEEALLYRAWKLWNEGEALRLMDESFGGNYAKEDAMKCIHIGLLCIQESVAKRPNMTSIVATLGGQSITLPLPSPPNFFSDSNPTSTMSTGISRVSSGQGVSIGQTSEITELHGR